MKKFFLSMCVALLLLLSASACTAKPESGNPPGNTPRAQVGEQSSSPVQPDERPEADSVASADVGQSSAVENSSHAEYRALVVYFSRSGNTETVAKIIAEETGSELYKIEVVKPYPEDYSACVQQAKQEKVDKARPALKGKLPDLSNYDVIYLGYPCWWYTCPMPVFTFVESVDCTGKIIVPFSTHGGSGLTGIEDLKKSCPKAKIVEGGFEVMDSELDTAKEKVKVWLDGLKI